MIERNLSELLIKFGISEDKANKLEDNLNGNDYQNLINYLSGNNINIEKANEILKKYNVSIKFNNLQESINNSVYTVKIRRDLKNKFIEYLENNYIDFENDGLTFNIDISNKNLAYKVDKFLSKIKNVKTENKKMRKRIKESKVTMVTPDVISIGSAAGLDMKQIREAFDVVDEYDIDTTDYDFYDEDEVDDDTLEIDDVEDVVVESDGAYVAIKNAISDIENNIGFLKLNEYKLVMDDLTNLLDLARQSGFDYLG